MIDINDYLNLNSQEERIEKAILNTKKELNGLTEDTMCMVYSSYLYENLKKEHVISHIIDTNDLNIEYKHRFILIPKDTNQYYLADLTYSQFKEDKYLKKLLEKGYELMDNEKWKIYLKIISNNEINVDIDNAFYKR